MKKLYFLVVVFVVGSMKAQNPNDIINIPDANFKSLLLSSSPFNDFAADENWAYISIDENGDGEIQESEALQVIYLDISVYIEEYEIENLGGLESFQNLRGLELIGMNMPNLEISLPNLETLGCNHCMMDTITLNLQNLKILFLYGGNLNSIDLSSLPLLEDLYLSGHPLNSIDISTLTSLEALSCEGSNITEIDLSNNPLLTSIGLGNNKLTSIDVSVCPLLKNLDIYTNELTTLDVSLNGDLEILNCGENQLTMLDVSNNYNLNTLGIGAGLNPIEKLFINNGNYYSYLFDYLPYPSFEGFPNLQYLCVNEENIALYQEQPYLSTNVELNSYCSFNPSGEFYVIEGGVSIDGNNNGCDISDSLYSHVKFHLTDGVTSGTYISKDTELYTILISDGTHTLSPIMENATYFNISPPTASVTFPETTSPFTQNFCITPNGLHPDLEVAILPTTPARPGFDVNYKLIIKNKGSIQQSGSISFVYNDVILDYIIAAPLFTTQAEGLLSWAFANLEPFETREINITLNVNSPMENPAVNGGDVLNYTATITSDQVDELPLDNTFSLPQIVVNSFDPNDKTCLEGTAITPDMIGKYVHYMIRFENTGTFAAENIVVKDMIDTAKFDVSSLVALNGSHPYVTRITGNKVEFIFEGINLPFDDANNDGYVVFKIKTLPTLVLGDSFSNTASIYFDFNHPIVTEPAVTTFAVLGTEDFVFNNYFTLYPNPTNGILNITSKRDIELQSISIYNVLGQMVVSVPNAKGVNNVDVSSLSTGNYFIKVVSDRGTSNAKFIKQ
ncbi:hypothetical protein J2X31_003547 [Flavobacterium arsenatis]|uniref:T9SS type A sorting domain-containing protein n=1 Tax=Flavobacterium arsenatis TaxID=1484332 RepID=A0ABU1TUF6_9FLAO|nr:T9SS type A sorting domain-containing protein [Flavobacterium arsenatis]MDR6969514.1 hypothetical protein [Flavobacterium arsenatis]